MPALGGNRLAISGSNAPPNFDAASTEARRMGEQNLRERVNANPPSYGLDTQQQTQITSGSGPSWAPTTIGSMPVSYDGPSKTKALLSRRNELAEQGGVIRTMEVDKELDYMQYMEDVQELAKFDNYVEALVDPKAPGSADFLFKVYPEYVNRRMSQAQQDYEYALRNQMIDMWGINSFDDLYFKYMVDQGAISGPRLVREEDPKTADDMYISFALLPGRFKRRFDPTTLKLPYTSSKIGSRSTAVIDRKLNEMPYSNYYDAGPEHGKMATEPEAMAQYKINNTTKDTTPQYSWSGGKHKSVKRGVSIGTYA